jgi:hypothetical protein
MKCQHCGNVIYVPTALCPHCGVMPQGGGAYDIGADPAMRMLLPVGRSIWAIAAGYAGLFAVICFPAPLALFLGAMAIVDLKRHPEKHGWGRAIFGLVMGIVGTVLLILALVPILLSR